MLARLENIIVDDMTNRQVRYVKPVLASDTEGDLARLYDQIRSDFQVVPPLTLFSPAVDLLAGVWSIWRESQFAVGKVPRRLTEIIAAGVSEINTCPYCVDAHTGMLHASSDHDVVTAIHGQDDSLVVNNRSRRILQWALANRSPGADIILTPPFSKEETPQIIGTAIVYHFINRMVTIFLEDTPLPVTVNSTRLRRLATKLFGATLGKSILKRQPLAGKSLAFIPTAKLAADLQWASSNSNIAAAFSGFDMVVEFTGQGVLSEQVMYIVEQIIDAWQGENMGLNRDWLQPALVNLSDNEKPVARLVLLAALAPYQVAENDIQAFRAIYPHDEQLLAATSWASFAAARRVGRWLYTGLVSSAENNSDIRG